MKIVFNTKSLATNNSQEKYFLRELLKRIILKYPEHEFIILTDHIDANLYFPGKNLTTLITRQPVRHPLLRKLWFDFKLPVFLRKYKADVFVSCDAFCSMTARLPQCLLLHDLTFFYNTSAIKGLSLFLLKRYIPKFLHKSNAIVGVSEFFKKDLSLLYKIQDDKITVVYTAAKEIFVPVNERGKEEIKKKYSNEKNYFIYTGAIYSPKSLMTLLKAFSVFKKRQKTNWKLIVTGTQQKESNAFHNNLRTYKYREDLILTGLIKDEDMVKLVGSAYAMIHPTQWDKLGMPLLEAMNCHIPVIALANPLIKEIAGDAALYANPEDHADIADKMMLLYKDETLRNSLVEKGKMVASNFSWGKTADLLWQNIEKGYASSGKTQP
ncbi:MAG: glycosyltransferase family 1 protein [Chitinophagaceae bacterium]